MSSSTCATTMCTGKWTRTHTHTLNCTHFPLTPTTPDLPSLPCPGCHGYPLTSTHMHITQPLQFIPFVTHDWPSYSYDQRERNGARHREKGVLGVVGAGWKGGWWTEAVFGSVWLAVIAVHSSRSPAVMVDRMTLSAFSLPFIVCVCLVGVGVFA